MRIWNLATVNEWYKPITYDGTVLYPLQNAIELGTYTEWTQETHTCFFDSIYLPVKQVTNLGIADDWTYVNIGLFPSDIAKVYKTYHGLNYLSSEYIKDKLDPCIRDLGDNIRSVFLLNKGKYLKMLELQGYTYNPLFNVDGVEIRQSLKNEGVNNTNRTYTPNNLTTTHNVSSYNSETKEEYNDVQTGSYTDNTNYTHNNAKNRMVIDGVETDVDYHVQKEDTAFGEALSGGDKMENEKYIRQGNIGTTKTQELIEAERQNLRFTVLKEFFDDINEQILVGIY